MLDRLDLLDDPQPPAIDAATLSAVHARANGVRRRTRLTRLGAAAAAILVVAGVATLARNRDREVKVIAPPSTTTPTPITSPARTSTGTLPNGLHVEMSVDGTTFQLGRDITPRVVVRNDTDTTKTSGYTDSVQCAFGVVPALENSSGSFPAVGQLGGCRTTLEGWRPERTMTFTVTLSTAPVALPPGASRATLGLTLTTPPRVATSQAPSWRLPPIPVEIVAPDLSGHLEIPKTDFVADDIVNGTVVIRNASGAAMEYRPGCNWDVTLEQHGVSFRRPQVLTACLQQGGVPTTPLPVGTTRQPFNVILAYPSCAGVGRPTVESPKSASDGGLPRLAAGDYQIVFTGLGAFGSLEIPPVTITVR